MYVRDLAVVEHETCELVAEYTGMIGRGDVLGLVEGGPGDNRVSCVVLSVASDEARVRIVEGWLLNVDLCDDAPELFDNGQAHREGWMVNERSDEPAFAIEKLDDPGDFVDRGNDGSTSFASDQDAYVHVVRRARAGSAYHASALRYLQRYAPGALRWAVEVERDRSNAESVA